MKLLITLLFVLCLNQTQAQIPNYNGNDTIKCILPVIDSTSWLNIYKSNGQLLKKATTVQPYSIPSGGWVSVEEFVNPEPQYIKGFYILKTVNFGTDSVSSQIIGYLDTKRKPLAKKWLVFEWNVPTSGYNRDPLTMQIK